MTTANIRACSTFGGLFCKMACTDWSCLFTCEFFEEHGQIDAFGIIYLYHLVGGWYKTL